MMVTNRTSEIPLFFSAVNTTDSSMLIGISDKAPLSLVTYEKELQSIIGNVPMKVFLSHFTREDCTIQSDPCRPIRGGIHTEVDSPPGGAGTLTLPATTTSGTNGFIISGHVADLSGHGATGQTVRQPYSIYPVGTVLNNPSLSLRPSDSAFVQYNSGITGNPIIFPYYFVAGNIGSPEVPLNSSIKMQGDFTPNSVGTLNIKGATISDSYGTLTNQDLANYSSGGGDSVAPVFSNDPDNVYFYGIHVGSFPYNGQTYRVYSPWEGIQADLNIRLGLVAYATEQSTGAVVSGLWTYVTDVNNVVLAQGYTPLYVSLPQSGTYYVNFSNYGPWYFTTTPVLSTTTNYDVFTGGGKVTVQYTYGDLLNVRGIYYNNNNPGNYAKVTILAKQGSNDLSMSSILEDNAGNLLSKGYTPYTVGLPISTITDIWNNYGTHVISSVTTNANNPTFQSANWGGTEHFGISTPGGTAAYSNQGNYS
jgi:hypothetical protein